MKKNKLLTFILCLGTLTVFFPLYMAIIIAFKQPSEMTNSVEGALSLPKTWSFSNFAEAMRVTDFWHSLGNSLSSQWERSFWRFSCIPWQAMPWAAA